MSGQCPLAAEHGPGHEIAAQLLAAPAVQHRGEHLLLWPQQQPGRTWGGPLVLHERDSQRRGIGCGTLASDARGSNPQFREGRLGRRPEIAWCPSRRGSRIPCGENTQVEGSNVDDSRCSYAVRRVFAANEIRGGTVIPPESRRRARARGSRPGGVPSPGRGRRVGTAPQARPFPRRAASRLGRGDRAGTGLRRPDRGDDAAPPLAAARPRPHPCRLVPARNVLHTLGMIARRPRATV